ncbi:WD40-repeat-containing domain protein [Fimicolochytrium jonesii]|uniref:WD40-repeat-containing domain protein n=1 Tax=Fimicolochytrium jonesii TaxID=1396493 RepID=UPI0022FE6F3D|nr:WD40-repeat-containing domain protein [Fimicolochytrium jonesii]KAI8817402.1 WD40-repeat-containing domain protein [Fimicolochytrium jonesii]
MEVQEDISAALTLDWAFGFNRTIVGGIHAIKENTIFYASAHVGVIYDHASGKQDCLMGHCNEIAALTTSTDKRFLVTADKGANSTIIVWDTAVANNRSGRPLPIRTLFDPHGGAGVVAVGLSADAKWLVSLGADTPQTICVYDWTDEDDKPLKTAVVEGPAQVSLQVNPADPFEILSTSLGGVNFYVWSLDTNIEQHPGSLSPKDFKHIPTSFTHSTFLPSTPANSLGQAMSATAMGDVVVWTDRSLVNLTEKLERGNKTAVKVMKLHNGSINLLTIVGGKYLVTGGGDGFVRVYDLQFRLIVWFERLRGGPIVSISTLLTSSLVVPSTDDVDDKEQKAPEIDSHQDLPDLIIATKHSKVIKLLRPMENVGKDAAAGKGAVAGLGASTEILMEGSYDPVEALAVHPVLPQFAVGGESGILIVWDYDTKRMVMSKQFDEPRDSKDPMAKHQPKEFDLLKISSLAYSTDGGSIALGFTNGTLRIVSSTTLLDLPQSTPASHRPGLPGYAAAKAPITRIAFSDTSVGTAQGLWMAIADEGHGVGVFHYGLGDQKKKEWVFVGRCRGHYKEIVGIQFVPPQPTLTFPRLMSVSSDRHLVEYDLESSSITAGVLIRSKLQIDQLHRPLAAALHPSPPLRGPNDAPQHYILTANSGSKFKLYNAETGMCRRTVVAPAYGGDIRHLQFVPAPRSESPQQQQPQSGYLAYATTTKVVGLVKLPLDGNPHRSMGLYAHPGAIAAIAATPDGKRLLTLGREEGVVNLWNLNPAELDKAVENGGTGVHPWLDLLCDGGDVEARDGFVREMEDYFYYAQLRSQGENAVAVRKISLKVPLGEVPLIMQAMGHYPSHEETDDMLNEVRYAGWFDGYSADLIETVGFDDLIKLYINHRPIQDFTRSEIYSALSHAKRLEPGGAPVVTGPAPLVTDRDKIRKEGLISLLQQYGESLSTKDFTDAMASLLQDDPTYMGAFPERFTPREFVEEILGLVPQVMGGEPARAGEPAA